MINSNNEPYMRKKISPTLLALSAAIALLLTSQMLFFNVLLQPVQASQLPPIAFKTPEPAISFNGSLALTFEAEGFTCPSSCDDGDITSGTFLLNHTDGSGQVDSGTLQRGDASAFINQSSGVTISLNYEGKNGGGYVILASCSTSDTNHIGVLVPPDQSSEISFRGGVECPVGGGEGEAHSAQPASSTPSSSLTAGSSQGTDRGNGSSSSNSTDSNSGSNSSSSNSKDGDGDGIHDSSDNCPHNSNHRCFKEGGDTSTATTTTTTSTNQQQEQASSSIAGNQTR
jgi:hypothetical protein